MDGCCCEGERATQPQGHVVLRKKRGMRAPGLARWSLPRRYHMTTVPPYPMQCMASGWVGAVIIVSVLWVLGVVLSHGVGCGSLLLFLLMVMVSLPVFASML